MSPLGEVTFAGNPRALAFSNASLLYLLLLTVLWFESVMRAVLLVKSCDTDDPARIVSAKTIALARNRFTELWVASIASIISRKSKKRKLARDFRYPTGAGVCEMSNKIAEISDVHKAAWGGFLLSHAKIVRTIDSLMASQGEVSLEQYDVLLALEEAPEQQLTMTELADAVVFSPSGLTRLVDRMVKQGFLERCCNLKDKRSTYAKLTKHGLETRSRSWILYSQLLQDHFACHVSKQDAKHLVVIAERILNRKSWPGHNHNCAD